MKICLKEKKTILVPTIIRHKTVVIFGGGRMGAKSLLLARDKWFAEIKAGYKQLVRNFSE